MPNSSTSCSIITGATASGKSAYALMRAAEQPSAIINADSMQLYQDAPILTAQPDAQSRGHIPHHLYSVRPAKQPASVACWLDMAVPLIRSLLEQSIHPIIVGGTGLYIKSLMHGLSPIPPIPDQVRTEVRAMSQNALHHALSIEDPELASALNPSDTQRLARALEVMRATGHSLYYWNEQPNLLPLPEVHWDITVTDMPREALYARINLRVLQMFKQGAEAEAKALYHQALPRDLPLMRAVGVAEMMEHFDGDYTLDDTITRIQKHSRHYAKRQYTWMRHQLTDATYMDVTP